MPALRSTCRELTIREKVKHGLEQAQPAMTGHLGMSTRIGPTLLA